jgi:hypothetical protein
MTKGELRKARKAARANGQPLTGDLAVRRSETDTRGPAVEWTESARGYRARDRWARRYDSLNGAPEGDWDR